MMCIALFIARPIPNQPSRTMRLWLLSVVAFLGAGVATSVAQRTLGLPPVNPITSSMVATCLGLHAVLQWFAVHDVKGPRIPGRKVLAVTALVVAMSALMPWVLGPRLLSAWPTVINVIGIVAVLPGLRLLARQGVGGRAIGVSLLLQLLPNLCALTGVIDVRNGDLPILIVGNLVTLFGATLGLLIWHQGRMEDLLARIAMTDALTGALNRHGLNQQLTRELARSERQGSPLSVVLCDLDHFKRINDTHGHDVGDDVLRRFVAQAKKVLRKGDCIGRWGGEEFVLVLPDTATQHAVAVAERMRASPVVLPGVDPVTFSAGVATSGSPECGYDLRALLSSADKLLYVAKETRDRVVAANEMEPTAAKPAPRVRAGTKAAPGEAREREPVSPR